MKLAKHGQIDIGLAADMGKRWAYHGWPGVNITGNLSCKTMFHTSVHLYLLSIHDSGNMSTPNCKKLQIIKKNPVADSGRLRG